MELSERIIATLESQGYSNIEEQQYVAGVTIVPTSAATTRTIHVTDGSSTVTMGDVSKTLGILDQLTIPPHVPYSITAGPAGCQLVVGEK